MPVLNDADALYVGSSAVDKVYLGAVLVWPPTTPPTPGADFPFARPTDAAAVAAEKWLP